MLISPLSILSPLGGVGLFWGQHFYILRSGPVQYRREINNAAGYFKLDYSEDSGATWENLETLYLTENLPVIDLAHIYHHRIVDYEYRVDNFLTPLGYAGVEGVDWENLYTGSGGYYNQQNIDELVVELQPDSTGVKDAYIFKWGGDKNTGANELLAIGDNGGNILRSLIQFDLSSLPDNAIITSCRLHLLGYNTTGNNARALKLYRLKRDWVEGVSTGEDATINSVCWNKYDGVNAWQTPGAFGANDCEQISIGVAHSKASPIAGTVLEFEISAKTKEELDLGYGWLIKADIENDDVHLFRSSNITDLPISRPGLFISYILPDTGISNKFKKSEYNPMIQGWFGSVIYNGVNDYKFYYSNGTNVYKSDSTDGLLWTKDLVNSPIMIPSAGTIQLITVWKETIWYMLYRSTEWGGGVTSIGLATSPDGVTWTKYANNPVIIGGLGNATWDDNGIDPVGIIKIGNVYNLWYNNVSNIRREIGLATSTDLIHWTKDVNNPIFSNFRYCSCPFKYKGYYYMLVPHTIYHDTNQPGAINNLIELYRDSDPKFLPTSRKYLGIILNGGGIGSWDNLYLDTPSVLTNDIKRDSFPTTDLWMYYNGTHDTNWLAVLSMASGLAIGDFDIIDRLEPQAEPL